MGMNFRPLHDRVVVKRIDEEEKTAGGIIIPDTAKEKPMQGKIVAVGPGKRNDSGELAVGRQIRGYRDFRQVVRHGSDDRWSGSPDYE